MRDRNRHPHLLVSVAAAVLMAGAAGPAVTAAPAASGHDAVSCRLCHAQPGSTSSAGAALTAQRCVGCHPGATRPGPAPTFHGRGRCLDCHGFHSPGTVATTAGTVALGDLEGVDRAHCLPCHDGKGSLVDLGEAHRAAGRLYHENAALLRGQAPSTPCLWCHSESRSTAWQAVPAADRLAFVEHASHPIGIDVRPGRGPVVRRMREIIDPRIPLPGGRIECISCHQLTAGTEDRLRPLAEPQGLCLGCHQLNQPSGGAALATAGVAGP